MSFETPKPEPTPEQPPLDPELAALVPDVARQLLLRDMNRDPGWSAGSSSELVYLDKVEPLVEGAFAGTADRDIDADLTAIETDIEARGGPKTVLEEHKTQQEQQERL